MIQIPQWILPFLLELNQVRDNLLNIYAMLPTFLSLTACELKNSRQIALRLTKPTVNKKYTKKGSIWSVFASSLYEQDECSSFWYMDLLSFGSIWR